MYSFTRLFYAALAAVLFAIPLGTLGQESCIGNVCLSCPDCSIISPSYTAIGNTVPTVGDLKKSCLCAGCADISNTECLATDAGTGEPLPDSTPVAIGNGISMGGMDEPMSGTSSTSSPSVTFECPAGCSSVSYSPVILGSEISVGEILSSGCSCMVCPGGGLNQCKISKDGKQLTANDVLTATEAMSAQQVGGTSGMFGGDMTSSAMGRFAGVLMMFVLSMLCILNS